MASVVFLLDPLTKISIEFHKECNSQFRAYKLIEDPDVKALQSAGWDDAVMYEATAIISVYNMSGRMEVAPGLPEDRIPEHACFSEGMDSFPQRGKSYEPV